MENIYFVFGSVIVAIGIGIIFIKSYKNNEKNRKKFSEITEIVLLNQLDEKLSFTRPSELTEVKYQEVSHGKFSMAAGHIIQSVVPLVERAHTLTELSKMAPYGLYTATVDPTTLSKFSNGTITTMVRNSDNVLTSHAGFEQISGMNNLSPIAVLNIGMQAAAAATGQYYLDQIYSQLNIINSKLSKLLDLHHDETIGGLLSTKKRLSEIIGKDNVDGADIYEIRILRKDTRKILESYKVTFERESKAVSNYKEKSWQVERRVKEYKEKVEELIFLFQVYFEAERLCLQADLAEISVRMKIKPDYSLIRELINQFETNFEDSLCNDLNKKITELFEPIHSNAQKIVGDGKDFKIINRNQTQLLKQITDKAELLAEQLSTRTGNNLFQEVLNKGNEAQEILLIPGGEDQMERVFIPIR